jgi:hypothetical protein
MSFQHHPTVLKKICSTLGIVIEKYFHFGRFYGNTDGELNRDLSSSELENLGKYLITQREECYSTKLPLRPMRVMAKHPERKGGYFCARGTVVPPLELHKMVFPFVEKTNIEMTTLIAKGVYHPTAMGFINMLEHLSVVIIQDAA